MKSLVTHDMCHILTIPHRYFQSERSKHAISARVGVGILMQPNEKFND